MKQINFDMDGTIADLYKVDNWLEKLRKFDETPYELAEPMFNMIELSAEIKRVQSLGYKVNIISWLSKESTSDYDVKVIRAKRLWLSNHLSVKFDEIHIIPYNTPKVFYGKGILFDDTKSVREEWNSIDGNFAFDEKDIISILKTLQ